MAMPTKKIFPSPFQISINIIIFILLLAKFAASEEADDRKVYVVYMGHNAHHANSASFLHTSMLNDVVASDDGSKYLRHSYSRSFHGFSAKLTTAEAHKLARMERVVSVFPSEKHKLHTTRSWDYLGLSLGVKRATSESDIIIGVLDTGIWPESESFNDKGYGPPPAKWKGTCIKSANFSCNNKIIGAQYFRADGNFTNELKSPRDSNGHGTHTASTAAGNIVQKASYLGGVRLGTARGGVPRARIAVYKVCWQNGCADEDFLAAFDNAIADGVDIISISAGAKSPKNFLSDTVAIGSFHAMRKEILTSHSANNEGPNPQTTSSVAPWILSVAASTMESKLVTPVQLGNHVVYNGISSRICHDDSGFTACAVSLIFFIFNSCRGLRCRMYPLIDGAEVPNTKANFTSSYSKFCIENSLNKELVKGKIVLCRNLTDGSVGVKAGASGLVMEYDGPQFDLPGIYPLPAASVKSNESTSILEYIKSTRKPTAVIKKTIEIKDALAPYAATFSGRGPNAITYTILKPDLSAPGVAILAAYSPIAAVSDAADDKRSVAYNIISGTSMACPHVSGIAAYIKSFHPTWSPAAIKSALMTTASSMSNELNTEAEFAYGSGHVDPLKALDPGLIYDAGENDYVMFMCTEGYTTEQVKQITGNKNSDCSAAFKRAQQNDLNYPSFVVPTLRNIPTSVTFSRTVTNVGSKHSTYKATVYGPYRPDTLVITVEPEVLEFRSMGQKLSYNVTVGVVMNSLEAPVISCSLVWTDGDHQVRSPIVLYVPT